MKKFDEEKLRNAYPEAPESFHNRVTETLDSLDIIKPVHTRSRSDTGNLHSHSSRYPLFRLCCYPERKLWPERKAGGQRGAGGQDPEYEYGIRLYAG